MLTTIIMFVLVALGFWLIFEYLVPKLPQPMNVIATVLLVVLAIVWVLNLMFPFIKF